MATPSQESASWTTALPAAPLTEIYPPYRPKSLAATVLAADQIKLTWLTGGDKGGSGTGGYEVYRDGILVGVSRTVSFVDSGLAPATTYTYTVSAYDKASPTNSGPSTTPAVTATTLAAPVPAP